MAGYRRELLEILEIDWEARPRCGTQSSKENRGGRTARAASSVHRTETAQPGDACSICFVSMVTYVSGYLGTSVYG